jgi:hypothetical protein
MDDGKRHAVLRQVVSIILELSSQRFDEIGALFKREGVGRDAWYIKPMSYILDPGDPTVHLLVSRITYTSGTSHWLAIDSANLQSIIDDHFGAGSKSDAYAQAWFLRSLVPALYDNSLDYTGFPLLPGDFHSQNIFITDVDSPEPHITGVIDWEWSSTVSTAAFAQYPLFVVDHPMWPDDHPLRTRNVHDQATFNELMRTVEREANPESDLSLSCAFKNCLGRYLFLQCMQDHTMSCVFYPQLFDYIFGDNADEKFSVHYYIALMEKGLLRKETEQFDHEAKVRQEAEEVLGKELVDLDLNRADFKDLVLENEDRFPVDGLVRNWLKATQ